MIATQLTKYGEVPLPEGIVSRTISNNNGLDMHILVSRPDEQKRPLIILAHGFPELAYSWRHILPAIASLGYVVVAPDQRGYGQTTGWSNRFEDSIEPFNLVNLARDIVGLVGALGYHQAQTIIGHDAGSYVAGTCALIRPDIFQSCVMMSAPFTGTPPLDQDSTSRLTRPSLLNFESQLNALKEPRKHYQVYYSTSYANGEMMNASQGLHQFIRAYYHHKSADWQDNQPVKLTSWDAEIMAQMPTYYIMNKNDTMPETVAPHMPSENQIKDCHWLTNEELAVYVSEYNRNTFQGGLQWYRCSVEGVNQKAMSLFAGCRITVPSLFLSGKKDWGIYQTPGAIECMRDQVCTSMKDIVLIDNAGHWVQQEQSQAVIDTLSDFLGTI
ncbi:MAG: alpha/beta hydrolase [Burkholderiales bacterium]|jgi:pimeloyl-ACP methyl ester carboxylesterase|nr:alpha/beta hydrolase [Burkholderiales bacterium]MCH1424431.1 alpha/beta hydrolase [Burkholderiales bacterium]